MVHVLNESHRIPCQRLPKHPHYFMHTSVGTVIDHKTNRPFALPFLYCCICSFSLKLPDTNDATEKKKRLLSSMDGRILAQI